MWDSGIVMWFVMEHLALSDGERSSGASALGESKDALGWDAQP
jgi:hypothetical protein